VFEGIDKSILDCRKDELPVGYTEAPRLIYPETSPATSINAEHQQRDLKAATIWPIRMTSMAPLE
jgi:hypothetical protein